MLGTVQSRKMTPCPQEHVISLDNSEKEIKAVSKLWSGESHSAVPNEFSFLVKVREKGFGQKSVLCACHTHNYK